MVPQKVLADPGIGEQEGLEFLWEDVARPHRVPDVVRHVVEPGRRRRNLPEVAVGQVLDLVVVVEDHPPEARDPEILVQEVAGEDVRARELRDRVAVLADHSRPFPVVGLLEEQVERRQPALDVHVLDDDVVTVVLDLRRRHRLELVQ